MKQQIEKFKEPEEIGMEDSLPLPMGPLRAVPIALPKKRYSNTSSDCGINSLRFLSPAGPVISDSLHISQLCLMPSTSVMDHLSSSQSWALTPTQHFIENSCTPSNKEHKYKPSHVDHPDPQSVLRIQTRLSCKL